MRRVAALTLTFLEPASFFEQSQHGIQQHLFGSPLNEAFAKVREQGKVEPRISQFQSQSILPIDAPSHRIRRLSIREFFHELHDGDQSQAPGGLNGASSRWKQMGKALVLIDGSQGIAHLHIRISLGIDCTSNTDRLFGDRKLVLRL